MPCLSMKATSEPRLLPGSLSALCLELSICSADLFALPYGSTHPQTLSPLSSPPLPPVLSLFYPHTLLFLHFVFMVNSLIHLWFSQNKFCVALSMPISTRRMESWSMLDFLLGNVACLLPQFLLSPLTFAYPFASPSPHSFHSFSTSSFSFSSPMIFERGSQVTQIDLEHTMYLRLLFLHLNLLRDGNTGVSHCTWFLLYWRSVPRLHTC